MNAIVPQSLILRNIRWLVTFEAGSDEGLGLRCKVDLLIEGGKIAAIDQNIRSSSAASLDCSDKMLMPGFVNAHDHLWQTSIRGQGDGLRFPEWCKQVMRPQRSEVSYASIYSSVATGVRRCIDAGITTVLDWSQGWNHDFVRANINALADSPIRHVFAHAGPKDPASVELIVTHVSSNTLASAQWAAHPSTGKQQNLNESAALSRKMHWPLNLNYKENREESCPEVREQVQTIMAGIDQLVVNHAIHLDGSDIEMLSSQTMAAVHCPLSNARFASGVMPVDRLMRSGTPIALGLDGGKGGGWDMFEAMRCALGTQRLASKDPAQLPGAVDFLRAATVGGARAVGMGDEIGTLAPGKRADIVVFNCGEAFPLNSPPSPESIVYTLASRNIYGVMVDGEIVKGFGRKLESDRDK